MPRKRWEAFIWYSGLLLENFRFSTVLWRLGRITNFPAFCRKPQVSSAEFHLAHSPSHVVRIRPLCPSPANSFQKHRLRKV